MTHQGSQQGDVSSDSRPLVIFFVPPEPSHIFSVMGLAGLFRNKGCVVEFWCAPGMAEDIKAQGFAFCSPPGVFPMKTDEFHVGQLIAHCILHPLRTLGEFHSTRSYHRNVAGGLESFAQFLESLSLKPVLVVFDPFRLGYYPFFRRAGIPCVVLSSKPLLARDPGVPPHTSALIPKPTRWGRLQVRMAWLLVRTAGSYHWILTLIARSIGIHTFEEMLHMIAEKTGFPIRSQRIRRWLSYDLHFNEVPEWVLWTPQADFPRIRPLPQNTQYIGPWVYLQRLEPELPFRRRPHYRYLIYVCMGKAVAARWKRDVALLRRVIAACKDISDAEVILVTGHAKTIAALGPFPENIRAFPSVGQLKTLSVADLAITHAGAGTVRECIMKEVPMLAYPAQFDQVGNAARVAYLGLGLRGSRRTDSVSAIQEKIRLVLRDETFKKSLCALKNDLKAFEANWSDGYFAHFLSSLKAKNQRQVVGVSPDVDG